jgi:GT2 family glycosyltransferase
MAGTAPSELHAIVTTHTVRGLRRTLLGVAHQRRRAESVTVACDNDRADVEAAVRAAAAEFSLRVRYVRRPFAGAARPAQTRNNAVRSLLADGVADGAFLVFLDGDCVPLHDTFERYAGAAARGDLVIGWRVYVTEPEQDRFDEEAVKAGREPLPGLVERHRKGLDRRQCRYRRQRIERWFRLGKSYKPKVLGGNHGIWLSTFRAVNGFDERFQGWGREDDDLGRRVYAIGGKPVLAVNSILVCHQDHPQRPKDDAASKQAHDLLSAPFTPRCEAGLDSPLAQSAPRVSWCGT